MNIPEARKKFTEWMSDPIAEDTITKEGSIDASWIGFWEGWKAALSDQDEMYDPVAWIIDYTCECLKCRAILGHNAIADYRDIDPDAVSTPLYTHPDNSKLRKAAEEALHWLAYMNINSAHNQTQVERARQAENNLRAALEGK